MIDRMSLSKYCLLSTKLVESGCDDESLKNITSVNDVLTGEKVDLGKLITDYLNDEDNALVSCDCLAEIEIHVRVIEKVETRFEFEQKDETHRSESAQNNWGSNMDRLITINDTYYQPSHEANS